MNSTLLAVALIVTAPALKVPPKNPGSIVGEWIPESGSMGGKAAPLKFSEARYQFTADGKWMIHRPDAKVNATPREFKLDLKSDPMTIDIHETPPAPNAPAPVVPVSGKPMLGIWKLEGDTLTLFLSIGGHERPKSFESPDDARVMKMVLKRAKPGDLPAKK